MLPWEGNLEGTSGAVPITVLAGVELGAGVVIGHGVVLSVDRGNVWT